MWMVVFQNGTRNANVPFEVQANTYMQREFVIMSVYLLITYARSRTKRHAEHVCFQ
jgi:hypothetical protein